MRVKVPPLETAGSSDSAPSPTPLLPGKPPKLETATLENQHKVKHLRAEQGRLKQALGVI